MPKNDPSLVLVRSVAATPLAAAVRECMERCDWESWVAPGAAVVIKPNLCAADAKKVAACNTDVAVAEAVCRVLRERTRRIVIGESGHLRQNPWQAFQSSGYMDMARKLDIQLVNFSESETTRVQCEAGVEIGMPRLLVEADVYINLPKLKTHALTYFTGALKNQWGCVPDCHDRLRYHRSIHTLLASIQRLLRPKFILMDGILGMDGRGPVNGRPRRLDAILASRDAVALDATAMRLVGLTPERARHVVCAARQGLGRIAPEDISVEGDWDRVATQFTPPLRDFANSAMFFATQYPWFVKHVLANDRVYFPIRDAVVSLRRLGVVAK